MIKVLIVDDSSTYRSLIRRALSDLENIDIIGSLSNGESAIKSLSNMTPDVITLDIEMPQMNGIEVLKKLEYLKVQRPELKEVKIIMVSAFSTEGAKLTLDALEAGATDFITKPQENSPEESFELLKDTLHKKFKGLRRKHKKTAISKAPRLNRAPLQSSPQVILIGSSTGGPKALLELLPAINQVTDLPILIVQHMPALFTKSLADSLNKTCTHHVQEAQDQHIIQPGHIYIAPGDYHMTVLKLGDQYQIRTNQQTPENFCRPSVDVLFRSAAHSFQENAIALILTGMGSDGTKGLQVLKRKGVHIIAQDQKTSVVWGMAGSAVEQNLVDDILPLDNIASQIKTLLQGN